MTMYRSFIAFICVWLIPANIAVADSWEELTAKHPTGTALRQLYSDAPRAAAGEFTATGFSRRDYLPLIAGNVDFFKQHQSDLGGIVDPYEHKERQYSTPAFALSAALLVQEAGRDDLLDPAIRAMSFATAALANKTTADNHADFYIPMLMHAHRILKSRAPRETVERWAQQLTSLLPEQTYRRAQPHGNWNLVNVSGEALRCKDTLVAPDQQAAQWQYIQTMLSEQLNHFSDAGMYRDPNVPLAYDAFPRLWLEDMHFDGAYDGQDHEKLEELLTLGGLSTLLLLSPSGEWARGRLKSALSSPLITLNALQRLRASRINHRPPRGSHFPCWWTMVRTIWM